MNKSLITRTSMIYRYCATARLSASLVSHELFSSFCREFRDLRKQAKERCEEDEDWALFIKRLSNYAYVFSGVPLPFNSPLVLQPEFREALGSNFRRLSSAPADLLGHANAVLELLDGLMLLAGNPLFNKLKDLVDQLPSVRAQAIVVAKTKYLSATQQFLSLRWPQIRVVSPHVLCGHTCYDRLFLIGSPDWYPSHVFDAPRSPELHCICYDWLHVPLNSESFFADQSQGEAQPHVMTSMDSLDFLHRRAISRFVSDRADNDGSETVSARLFLLEGEKAVFLEVDDTARAYILDMDGGETEEDDSRVERISVDNIQPGMFVLLRTSGGGDFIPEVADLILGTEAERARHSQQLWKERLAALVRSEGLDAIAKRLRANGSKIANQTNVRNWASLRSIKTNEKDDFLAIMRVIGLEKQSDDIWHTAELIDSAHRRAGVQIRKMLLQEVNKSDLTELASSGTMEFSLELHGAAGGSLTAFRVLSMARELRPVPYHKVSRPFSLEEDLWQE